MRKYVFAGVGILLLALMARAGDPWKDKPFQQWTDNDIALILQTSPWAKINQSAGGAWRPMDTAPVSGAVPGNMGGTGEDRSKTAAGSIPGQPGGTEKNANAGPATYNIFWWSSRTIRAAVARRAVIHAGQKPEDAEKFVDAPHEEYEILIQGKDMSVFEQRGEQAFQDAAFIQLKKSKAKVAPSHVAFQRGADGKSVMGAVFYFAKATKSGEATIAPDEKEVDFYLHIGDATLRTYFEPKKMLDSKGEDL